MARANVWNLNKNINLLSAQFEVNLIEYSKQKSKMT